MAGDGLTVFQIRANNYYTSGEMSLGIFKKQQSTCSSKTVFNLTSEMNSVLSSVSSCASTAMFNFHWVLTIESDKSRYAAITLNVTQSEPCCKYVDK